VAFHSYTEPHLATDNELVGNILLALLSSAKVEAQKISERTKAGMARAKAKGIKIDRPKIGVELRPLKWNLKKLHGAFKSLR
jgi:DNA invertase Pin-like site-specific DNA recombinase